MGRLQLKKVFCADFETTVYDGQEKTEVWAAAIVEINTEDVKVFNRIDTFVSYLWNIKSNAIVYFHNLKFDGSFLLDYFLIKAGFKQGYEKIGEKIVFKENKELHSKELTYSISHLGQWYRITVRMGKYIIEFRDSLKLLPFKLADIGKAFDTKHRKLTMEYKGIRKAGGIITHEEEKYIKNDVLVLKEAMEVMFSEGHTKLTIGSCCMAEFKKTLMVNTLLPGGYEACFPDLSKVDAPYYTGCETADEYVRKSYKGAWCYVVPEKSGKIFKHGVTVDANSLYPSQMSSESGNCYPIGKPHFFKGDIPKIAKENFYFVRIRCRFQIKEGFLPFIQIKNNPLYKPNEHLITSDVYDKKTGKYYKKGYKDDELVDVKVTLTLTMMDFELMKKHYILEDLEILDGCWFYSVIGIFDEYIEKYKKIKVESKGAKRTLAKLFLNNLYGKMASSLISSFKVAYVVDNQLKFYTVNEKDKEPGYIPCGSAITSYARCETINRAQANYYGNDKPGFIYADTDSLHCDLEEGELKGIPIDDNAFNHWKVECHWEEAIFTRQKTYIEKVDGKYQITCAGMPENCKDLLNRNLLGELYDEDEENNNFLSTHRTIKDFKVGLKIPGKLLPKRVPGGIILCDTSFEIR